MKIDVNVLAKLMAVALLKAEKSGNTAQYLSEMIAEYTQFLADMDEFKQAQNRFRTEMAQREKAIKETQTNLQNRCQHWLTTYIPDASGNNDSEYRCDICGKYGKKL